MVLSSCLWLPGIVRPISVTKQCKINRFQIFPSPVNGEGVGGGIVQEGGGERGVRGGQETDSFSQHKHLYFN